MANQWHQCMLSMTTQGVLCQTHSVHSIRATCRRQDQSQQQSAVLSGVGVAAFVTSHGENEASLPTMHSLPSPQPHSACDMHSAQQSAVEPAVPTQQTSTGISLALVAVEHKGSYNGSQSAASSQSVSGAAAAGRQGSLFASGSGTPMSVVTMPTQLLRSLSHNRRSLAARECAGQSCKTATGDLDAGGVEDVLADQLQQPFH